ncbi:MAG: DUF1330 domain-containing protein [Chloroflexi bacterium]|nr:DUF1330 domain-containing protein [Chloroflexota bacterium]
MSTYFIFHVRIHDTEKMNAYYDKAGATIEPFHHEILVIDNNTEMLEGNMDLPRTVVIKFDSREEALRWYNSDAYREARPLRLAATEGYTVLVDGLE